MTSLIILSAFTLTCNTFLIALAVSWPCPGQHPQINNFYSCVNQASESQIEFSKGFYDPNVDVGSFTTILNSTAENLRCLAKTVQKPNAIFTPSNDKQVQAGVQCAVWNLLNVRVRSGGHDYEGLSYISYTGQPFVVIDLRNIRNVTIDIENNTAWVDAGMTVGELYYWISQKSKTHAFPAGLCTDLGIGGHITGGAYGSLMRKYGLGVDNVIDAEIVNAEGVIQNAESMGDDLFWAIRGGGGGNLCIILRWRIRLVRVPEKVTVFSIPQLVGTGMKKGMQVLQKWQEVSSTIANELFIRVLILNAGPNTTIHIYQALYLGNTKALLRVMKKSFPELGLVGANCTEMSWIESVIFIAGFQPPIAPKDLLSGKGAFLNYFKAKSDFVTSPISKNGLEGMLSIFGEGSAASVMVFTPYGGKMLDFPEDETPYPHRNAIFKIQYVANWNDGSAQSQLQNEDWIRRLYHYMADHVSSNPREAYVNYRDLDIGKPYPGDWNCSEPALWGPKYYKGNYERLVGVKTMVDPWNVFHNEQSIPPAYMAYGCTPFDMMNKT